MCLSHLPLFRVSACEKVFSVVRFTLNLMMFQINIHQQIDHFNSYSILKGIPILHFRPLLTYTAFRSSRNRNSVHQILLGFFRSKKLSRSLRTPAQDFGFSIHAQSKKSKSPPYGTNLEPELISKFGFQSFFFLLARSRKFRPKYCSRMSMIPRARFQASHMSPSIDPPYHK